MRKLLVNFIPRTSLRTVSVLIICAFLFSCTHSSIEAYQGNKPTLAVETFFSGKLKATGIVKNRQGRVIRSFTADINASWLDGVGTLDEVFVFDDKEVQQRIWTIKPDTTASTSTLVTYYLATANDVVGEHRMRVSGNAIFMDYVLSIPYNNDVINVSVDDKMFLVDDENIINYSVMSKWGFDVGYVQLSIQKLP